MACPPSSALDFPSIGRSMSWGKNTEHLRGRPRSPPVRRGSLLRTITQVIARTTAARSPGCCTSLIPSPSVKGPFRRRFRRMSSPAPDLLLVIPHAPSLLGQVLGALFWRGACAASCLLSIKRPVPGPFSDSRPKKGRSDGSGDGGGRVEPSPPIRVVAAQMTLGTVRGRISGTPAARRSTAELLIPQAERWLWDLRVDVRSSRLRPLGEGCL